jgi:uncharacterized protein (TIGR02271 family)
MDRGALIQAEPTPPLHVRKRPPLEGRHEVIGLGLAVCLQAGAAMGQADKTLRMKPLAGYRLDRDTDSLFSRGSFMSEHIVATFATENEADAAARDLEAAGIPASSIRRYRPHSTDSSVRGTSEPATESGGGFWAWLLGEEPANETTRSAYPRDEEWYDQRAHAGNAVLSVMIHEDSLIHQALTILESHHPVEMEDRATEATAGSSTEPTMGSRHPVAGESDSELARASVASSSEEVIPLAKENIEVGKRTVDRGTTRIRRYVVETPVEREVTLHGERVTIERRRPVGATVADRAFEERTVEVHETEEVPVVEKTSHVTEEVAIRREQTERTEHVRDTVRREEVEITPDNPRTESPR